MSKKPPERPRRTRDPGLVFDVKVQDGRVIIAFATRVSWLELDPATARRLAEALGRCVTIIETADRTPPSG